MLSFLFEVVFGAAFCVSVAAGFVFGLFWLAAQ